MSHTRIEHTRAFLDGRALHVGKLCEYAFPKNKLDSECHPILYHWRITMKGKEKNKSRATYYFA